jgi:hypothetical protein
VKHAHIRGVSQQGLFAGGRSRKAEDVTALSSIGSMEIIPGVANFILCHLPEEGPTAAEVVTDCRRHNLFIRDVSNMGANLGKHAIRMAIKDQPTLHRMIDVLGDVLRGQEGNAATFIARALPSSAFGTFSPHGGEKATQFNTARDSVAFSPP